MTINSSSMSRSWLAWASKSTPASSGEGHLVVSAFTGYVVGQKDVDPLRGGPTVYAGDDFGFRAEGRIGDVGTEGRGWVTGKFVVKIEGRWVEARRGGGAMPVKK